jgi:S1-C subfamily serine protease
VKRLACVLALVVTTAAAGTRDPETPDAEYLALGDRFSAYTGRISGQNAAGGHQAASAVLLAPRWVVTAAHVVRGCTGLQVALRGDSHEVDLVVLHPDADREFKEEVDLALCRLVEPVDLPWYPMVGEVQAGQLLQVAGFGWTGSVEAGYDQIDGRLRAGYSLAAEVNDQAVLCEAARGRLRLFIAPGDSGGPAFAGSGSQARLVAINSYTTVPASRAPLRSRLGERSGHSLLAPHRSWLEQTMRDPRPDHATLAVE